MLLEQIQALPYRNQDTAKLWSVNASDYVKVYVALYKEFMRVRGRDPETSQSGTLYPATTNADVKQLAAQWSKAVNSIGSGNDTDRDRKALWRVCMDEVARKSAGKPPGDRYAANVAFWSCTTKIAIWLESRKARPSKWDMVVDSVKEAVFDLPDTLGSVAAAGGRATAGAAKGLFGEPVKLAAMVVGGAILLPPVLRRLSK